MYLALLGADEGWFVDVLMDLDIGVIADFKSFLSAERKSGFFSSMLCRDENHPFCITHLL